jgi:hypothetical protein
MAHILFLWSIVDLMTVTMIIYMALISVLQYGAVVLPVHKAYLSDPKVQKRSKLKRELAPNGKSSSVFHCT